MTLMLEAVGCAPAVAELGDQQIVVVVGKATDRRQGVHELGVLKIVSEQLVFDMDLPGRLVEEELAVRQRPIPLVQRPEQTELQLVLDAELVEDGRRTLASRYFRPHDGR